MMFHETEGGRKFLRKDMPKLADAAEYIAQHLHTDMFKLIEQLELLNHNLSKNVTQSMIGVEEVDDYLKNGWRFVGSIHNGRETFVIVETEKKGN